MRKVRLQTFRNNIEQFRNNMLKISLLFKKLTDFMDK